MSARGVELCQEKEFVFLAFICCLEDHRHLPWKWAMLESPPRLFSDEFRRRHSQTRHISFSYPMPWQGPNSGGPCHDVAELCRAVCRSHELIQEHVWKTRMRPIFIFLSEVVISQFNSTNVDNSTWRQEICTAMAWDKPISEASWDACSWETMSEYPV